MRKHNWDHYPNGFALNQWIKNRRVDYKRGKLSKEQIARLEAIPGWSWNPLDDAWNRGVEYYKKYGMVTQTWIAPDGFRLGQWIFVQKSSCRDPKRRKILEKLPGWVWNKKDAWWKRGFDYTKKYGIVNPTYKTKDGYGLGSWQDHQRQRYRRGTLDDDKIALLESIPDWYWNKYEHDWHINYKLSLKCGVVYCKTMVGDVDLGSWQSRQRKNKDPRKRKLLSKIRGWYWKETKSMIKSRLKRARAIAHAKKN